MLDPLTLDEVNAKAEALIVDTIEPYVPGSLYLWNIQKATVIISFTSISLFITYFLERIYS